MIVHSAKAPNAMPPTTATTMIAVLVPPEIPDFSAPAAATAEAVDETEAVLIDTEAVRAERVVPEVGPRDEESVTMLRIVETSKVEDDVEVLVDTGVLLDSTEVGVSDEEVLMMIEDEEELVVVGARVDELVIGTTDELELDTTATLELDEDGTTDELAAVVVETATVELLTLVRTLDVSTAAEVLCCPPISMDADAS